MTRSLAKKKLLPLMFLGLISPCVFSTPLHAHDGNMNYQSAADWSGPYIGAHIGDIWGDFDHSSPIAGPDGSGNSLIGGAQIGTNWQFDRLVLGVEGDASAINLSSHNDRVTYQQDYMLTARGRAGWAMDGIMPYVTAGIAFTDATSKVPGQSGSTELEPGLAIGGGLDMMLDQKWAGAWTPAGNWVGRVEYVHVGVPKDTTTGGPTPMRGGSDNNIIRVGLNYKF